MQIVFSGASIVSTDAGALARDFHSVYKKTILTKVCQNR